MGMSIEDLQPKSFTVNIKGVELTCKPLRLSHTLIVAKIGDVFQNLNLIDKEQIKQAEKDMDEVVAELIPELKDIQLDMQSTIDLITQMMEQVEPSDNKELNAKGVKFNTDPKAETNG